MISTVEKLPIDGAYLFTLSSYNDNRGKYVETWNEKDYAQYLPEGIKFIQDDFSHSYQRTLRGLHGDNKTWKLIQCIYGSINFVMFDINTRKAYEIVLTESNHQQVLVPPQCANGHLCLSPECIFYYKQSTFYGETEQYTIKWNDPVVINQVKWGNVLRINNYEHPTLKVSPILSERDDAGPFLEFRKD